jgi:hypothetical protein
MGDSVSLYTVNDFKKLSESVADFIEKRVCGDNFTSLLNKFRLQKEMPHGKVYKRAYIDRRVYNNFISKNLRPNKRNAIAIGIALELESEEMREFLFSAGYCLTNYSVFDLVVMYCIENCIYDINVVNALLIEVGERPFFYA